jgi:hypothetical protein
MDFSLSNFENDAFGVTTIILSHCSPRHGLALGAQNAIPLQIQLDSTAYDKNRRAKTM